MHFEQITTALRAKRRLERKHKGEEFDVWCADTDAFWGQSGMPASNDALGIFLFVIVVIILGLVCVGEMLLKGLLR